MSLFISSSPRELTVDYSPSGVSPHAVELFKIFIRLDYFLDTMLASDQSRTLALIKQCIRYKPEAMEAGEGTSQQPATTQAQCGDEHWLAELDKLLPGWKESGQLEAWILPSIKDHVGAGLNPRELSVFPFTALDIYLRQMNGVEFNMEQSKHIREQALELGVVDALLECLCFFSEQRHRFQPLRHVFMGAAVNQVCSGAGGVILKLGVGMSF
jgi:hypothetical protein